jgi:hypothetical protein
MEDERVISYERGKQLADSLGLEFFETSAKENINVRVSWGVRRRGGVRNQQLLCRLNLRVHKKFGIIFSLWRIPKIADAFGHNSLSLVKTSYLV